MFAGIDPKTAVIFVKLFTDVDVATYSVPSIPISVANAPLEKFVPVIVIVLVEFVSKTFPVYPVTPGVSATIFCHPYWAPV